jgi:decaprenylphospho-beta-D-ribofuranose 2-oxidase
MIDTVAVSPAVTFRELLARSLPFGRIPAVLPEHSGMTLGAALAADIHGCNHPGAGSLGHHLRWLDLRTDAGNTRRLSPESDPQAFWATVGGMGLTGTVTSMALQLRSVQTAFVRRTRIRTQSLEHLIATFEEVCVPQWFDAELHVRARLDAAGEGFGAGVIELTVPAGMDELPPGWGKSGLSMPAPQARAALRRLASSKRTSRRASRSGRSQTAIVHLADSLCHDHRFGDALAGTSGTSRPWLRNRNRRYEFVVPEDSSWLFAQLLQMFRSRGVRPGAAVITRLGVGNQAPLSFARMGWAMALELPAGVAHLPAVLDATDRMLARHGGRIRLTDASTLDPALVPSMYPQVEAWRSTRNRLNPVLPVNSDLGRRLALV